MDEPLEKIPYLSINLHTVYKLSPTDYSTEVDRYTFGCGKSKIQNPMQIPMGSLTHADSMVGTATPMTMPSVMDGSVGSKFKFMPAAKKTVHKKGKKVSRDFLEERKKDGASVSPQPPLKEKKSVSPQPPAAADSVTLFDSNGKLIQQRHLSD